MVRNGTLYKCIQYHGPQPSYDPAVSPKHWEAVGPCEAAPPTSLAVRIISPGNNTSHPSKTSLDIVTAIEYSGSHIPRLELYVNGRLEIAREGVGKKFVFPWQATGPGDYTLRVKAYGEGNVTAEDSISIKVLEADKPQHIHITSPRANEEFEEKTPVKISVDVRELAGKISQLHFYLNGQLVLQLPHTNLPAYEYTVNNLTAGTYQIMVTALNSTGEILDSQQLSFRVKKEEMQEEEILVSEVVTITIKEKEADPEETETIVSEIETITIKEKEADLEETETIVSKIETITVKEKEQDNGQSHYNRAEINRNYRQDTTPVVLGYFGSWKEKYDNDGNSLVFGKLQPYINHVFLAFAKPDLRYRKGSYQLDTTGLEIPANTPGQYLKKAVQELHAKGTRVILSIGGETYWQDNQVYDRVDYNQIKDLVDDFEFDGIDWDYEPHGGFQTIGNEFEVSKFIEFFKRSRQVMPRSEGYLLACAPAGVGALGGQLNNDPGAPFAYERRHDVTGEKTDVYEGRFPNNIVLFNYASSGHMIPVFRQIGHEIDLVAYQGYNVGAAPDRALMYDSYAYYANRHGFRIAAGTHIPNEPWGPYYTFTPEKINALSSYIREGGRFNRKGDGIMIWQLNQPSSIDKTHNGNSYLRLAYNALNNTIYNEPPEVELTIKGNNKRGPADIEITVNATDADGVAMVELYGNSKLLAASATVPFSYTWKGVQGGNHTVTVKATDNKNATVTTHQTVTVYSYGENQPCNVPAWEPKKEYPIPGVLVSHKGKVYTNQWWANPGEEPGADAVWKDLGEPCHPNY